MKAKAPKSHSSISQAHSSTPFFNKSGKGSFFSNTKETEGAFFSPSFIQPKLTIGRPGDKYEQEADAMADKIVQRIESSKSTPAIQTKCEACKEEGKLQKMEEEGNEKEVIQKSIFESKHRSNDALIQRKGGEEVDPSLEMQLNNSRGSGQTLDDQTRSTMEQGFNTDFRNVKVHTDENAVQMNHKLNAQAFTSGNDIYFNQGKYDPNTKDGNRLLAHELTHVIQQNGNGSLKSRVQNRIDKKIIQRAQVTKVDQVESLEVDMLENTVVPGKWSTLRKKMKARDKQLDDAKIYVSSKRPSEKKAYEQLKSHWKGLKTRLYNKKFDYLNGTLPSQSAINATIKADEKHMATLNKNKNFRITVAVLKESLTALKNYLKQRKIYQEEKVQWKRFDADFKTGDVTKLLNKITHTTFYAADVKAFIGQESSDLTNVKIAGIGNKKKGVISKKTNLNFVGIGQIGTAAMTDGIKWASKAGVTIKSNPDPRKIPSEAIKLAAAYIGWITDYIINNAKPAPKGIEFKKCVFAAYNAGIGNFKKGVNAFQGNNKNKAYSYDDIKDKTPKLDPVYVPRIMKRLGV
ncbi:MAG: DUF4157 domain-containing protein [Chitinophagales bacterium]|nr:DUF4157 domain-containing protein [Chitinophagales bacterium]